MVQAGFADGAHVWVAGQGAQLAHRATVPTPAFVRMHADGGEPALKALRELDNPPALLKVAGHDQHFADAGGDGTGVQRGQFVGEGGTREMRVRIEERGYEISRRGKSAPPPGTWCPAGNPAQPPAPQSPGSAGGKPKFSRMAVEVRGMAG